uniref:Uncharacterized protein n=1 Tax=viral metagenome TaxID=1070528 RepID=A0A6M3L6M2_9ZZZZ
MNTKIEIRITRSTLSRGIEARIKKAMAEIGARHKYSVCFALKTETQMVFEIPPKMEDPA